MTTVKSHTYDSVGAREQHIPRGLANTHSIFVARAEGSRLWDVEGHEYLDFTSGIGVLNLGHRHPRVVSAVREQLDRLMHTCFQITMYEPYVELAARLNQLVGGGDGHTHKTVLFTTGTEAAENAVKIARAYTGRPAVVAFTGGFHGRTLLSLTLTSSSPSYRQNFGPFAPEVYHAPYPDEYHGWTTDRALQALEHLFHSELAPSSVAAVIVEPELGEGGFVPAPTDFLRGLRDFTTEHGIVMICDEVQSGFGRTGRMFGYQHAGIDPDLVMMAKSLADGLPLSAITGRAAVMDAPTAGGLGGTYAGNPLACAAALAVLDVFEQERVSDRAVALGDQLRAALVDLQQSAPGIGDVRGLGCMLAIELVVDRSTKAPNADLADRIIAGCRRDGLLLLKCGPYKNVVRFLPPLTTTTQEMTKGIEILRKVVRESSQAR
jgi:4-aminobutyrate aminotransferase/(S)-3-amino-2-methylpropionate transaminase